MKFQALENPLKPMNKEIFKLIFMAIIGSNNRVKIETNIKFDIDAFVVMNDSYAIKPAAPLLACVIRRVFFCPDGKPVGKGGPG